MSDYAVGLTGGIGSGKTTVANLFAELGVSLVDADLIAREIVSPNSPALVEIIGYFGKQVLNADGSLNRKVLRDIVFKDDKPRIWLESLLHPIIRQGIKEQISQAPSIYCLVVIPLLKSKLDYPMLKRILVVDAPETLQISRIEQRDRVDEIQAKAILAAQLPRTERLKMADDIIINDDHIDSLRNEVKKLHNAYQQLFVD